MDKNKRDKAIQKLMLLFDLVQETQSVMYQLRAIEAIEINKYCDDTFRILKKIDSMKDEIECLIMKFLDDNFSKMEQFLLERKYHIIIRKEGEK